MNTNNLIEVHKHLYKYQTKHFFQATLAARSGYGIEEYEIITTDGYILKIFRILPRLNSTYSKESVRHPVLFVHGLTGNADYFLLGENNTLAFMLLDNGFDVWLMNSRGTSYSRKHVKYDVHRDKRYWDFSWHEIGVYDVPANVDFILEKTGFNQTFLIGHSQGTTVFLVAASTLPEFNDKIKLAVLFSPAAHIYNVKLYLANVVRPIYEDLRVIYF